ncbi:hypothetical protein LQW54_002550 [Pestalotiopsis sp. IQ-011]
MLYQALPLAALVASALAAPAEAPKCPETICVDGVSPCGVKFGSCYDRCDRNPGIRPTPPPCPASYSSALLQTSSAPISVDNCSTRSLCADYVNECGIWYGGCFADCTPWPTFSKPPCPSTNTSNLPVLVTPTFVTTTIAPPPSAITTPTSTDCSTQTVCADYINSCGQTYGGCFSACTPWPTFTPPPCPASNTTSAPAEITTSAGAADPVFTSDDPVVTVTVTSTPVDIATTPTPTTAVTSVCVDYFTTCTSFTSTYVLTWGG